MSDRVFRDAGIAVFEDRIIYEAQPEVTSTEIKRIEAQLRGPIPPDLRALWTLCYGGQINYDLDVAFGEHIHPFSFSELFFPDSGSYYDLNGWIAVELELLSKSRKGWMAWSRPRLEFLPIGGFEYLDRLYVRVGKKDYGAVYAYSEGIPPAWSLSLHENSFARVADSVRDLFRQLHLKEDPESIEEDQYRTGLEMLGAIDDAVQEGHLTADSAGTLKTVMRRAICDWRSTLESGDLDKDPMLCRLALGQVAKTGDIELLEELEGRGVNVNQPLFGSGSLLDHALIQGQIELVVALLDRGLPVGEQTMQCMPDDADLRLVKRLLKAGAKPNDHAVYSAIRSGNTEIAEQLAGILFADNPATSLALVDRCESGIASCETTAARIENRQMGSNRSPDDYREEAERLRKFADWIRLQS